MTRLLLIAAVLVGCSKKADPGPSCPQIVDHMLEVTKQQLPGHDSEQLGNRQQMIDQCEQRKMPPAMRKCLMAAKTFAALGECRDKDAPTPTPTRPLPTGEPAQGPTPPPAPPPTPAPAGPGSGG